MKHSASKIPLKSPIIEPPSSEGVSFESLPSFISYKAALKKERNAYKGLSKVLSILLVGILVFGGYSFNGLLDRLKTKEYIVFPEFVPVKPNNIRDDEIRHFAEDTLNLFGSFSAKTIEKNFDLIAERMQKDQRIKFLRDAREIILWAEEENIITSSDCTIDKIIVDDGIYNITSTCKQEVFSNFEHIKTVRERILMKFKLLAVSSKRKRLIEIIDFLRKSN